MAEGNFEECKPGEPLNVFVEQPANPMAFPNDKYQLPCGFKGYALIVNITKFDDIQRFSDREGAQHDTTYMKDLFKGLGFRVDNDSVHDGRITAAELKTIFENFRQKLKQDEKNVKCCVVYVGSHGSDPDQIVTSDIRAVDLYKHIVYQLDSNKCPWLNAKWTAPSKQRKLFPPKLFFVQACRSEPTKMEMSDIANDSCTDEAEAPKKDFLVPEVTNQKRNPRITDSIVYYATMPKAPAERSKSRGSRFAYWLAYVFMKNAHCMSLHDLLQETTKMISDNSSYGQVANPKPYLFDDNNLFFNLEPLSATQGIIHHCSVKPPIIPYYVSRTIRSRSVLTRKIFKAESGIFVFDGIPLAKLSGLVQNARVGNSGEQIMQGRVYARFLVLNHPRQFDKICEIAEEPVHWLTVENDQKLRWMKSSGGVAQLHQFIANEHQQDLWKKREEDFCSDLDSNSNTPICIVDSPGMGKSTLLWMMGTRMCAHHPKKHVAFLDLPQFIGVVKRFKNGNSANQNFDSIVKEGIKNLTCEFLETIENNEGTVAVELLLDGLDEVHKNEQELAYKVLKTILTSLRSVRMWVTSRAHLLHKLETTLNVLGHPVYPFTLEDQLHAITSYWRKERSELDPLKLNEFAKECLETLRRKMGSKDADIAGIPLQCLMIAEVFEEHAHIYAESGEALFVPEELQLNSIADMYRLLIERKMKKYRKISGNSTVGDEVMLNMHLKLAFELLLPEDNFPTEVEVEAEEVLKVGLLEASDLNSLSRRFIHRTFAEYLMTRYVVNTLTDLQWTEKLNTTLFDKLLTVERFDLSTQFFFFGSYAWENFNLQTFRFTSVYPNFFNCMLVKTLAIPESTLQFCHQNAVRLRSQLLHACIHANCLNLAKFFVRASSSAYAEINFEQQNLQNSNRATSELYSHLLQIAAQVSSLPVFQFILEEFQRVQDFSMEFQWRILQLAVRSAQADVVQFLLNETGLRKHFTNFHKLSKVTKELLHICIIESKDDSEQLIGSRIEMVRLLLEVSREFLEHKAGRDKETPLLCNRVHPRLLLELIQLGADVFAEGRFKRNFFDLDDWRYNFTSTDYCSIIGALPLEDLKSLVTVKNVDGESPLHYMFWREDPLPETLSRLQVAGENFTRFLGTAIEKNRSVGVLCKLIECGADVKWKGPDYKENLLHVAVQWGNMDAAILLVHEYGLNPKERTSDNRTILHLFCDKCTEHNILDIDSLTPLMPLEEFRTLVNVEDDYGEMPLQRLLRYRDLPPEAVNWLHEAGANFNHLNKKGYSILAVAVRKNCSASMLRKLIECGADVRWRSRWKRRNLLHYAAKYGNWEAVEHLVKEMGFDVNEKSRTFSTPLSYAETARGYRDGNKDKTIKILKELGAK